MRRAVALATTLLACADLVGIEPLPDGGTDASLTNDVIQPDGNGAPCSNAATVFSTPSSVSKLRVDTGYVYTGVGDPIDTYSSITRCPITGCAAPTAIVPSVAAPLEIGDYDVSTTLAFTLENPNNYPANLYEETALDGTNGKTTSAQYSTWIASLPARLYWVEDSGNTPALVHCAGCIPDGGVSDWISGLNVTSALIADSAWVYVLALDGAASATLGVFGCASTAPCGASPHTFITGLDGATSGPMLASDGQAVYVASSAGIARIDLTGSSNVYPNLASAIAVDPSTKDLFYVSPTGIWRGKSDGSITPVQVSTCIGDVLPVEVAFDATYVYFLAHTAGGAGSAVFAVHR